jgi:branched-chain amino acid transport system substrate-binding protein
MGGEDVQDGVHPGQRFRSRPDAEEAFAMGFKDGGGVIVDSVRVPWVNPDFATYLQRVKDAKPAALMVFIPAGKTATAVLKAFGDLGLAKASIKLIGPGDVTPDEELATMGEAALGVLTVHHYSAAATRPANRAFVAAWKQAYEAASTPNFVAVGGWDGIRRHHARDRRATGQARPGQDDGATEDVQGCR